MSEPRVTIVVVPRERFSYTQASLESIYQYTDVPFKLVYVDGNSPAKVSAYLQKKAEEKGFKLFRTDHYLIPNHARNLGLKFVDTEYLVFLDNDVIVSAGWLTALIICADTTGAAVVTPLTCEQEPLHQLVHCAGGENRIITDVKGKRHLREKMYQQKRQTENVRPQMHRAPTELAEFHCMLVRTEVFQSTGPLDPKLLCTKEHLDFCMTVAAAGETIYFEPDAIVTYVPGPPADWSDLHFYLLRWSDAWTLESLQHLQKKWDLAEDGYFKTKYKKLGWRRRKTVITPLTRRLSFGFKNPPLRKALQLIDRWLNSYLTDRYAKKVLSKMPETTPTALSTGSPVSRLNEQPSSIK
ncbi:MAG: glycosyltransferase family 2 protein [Microcoleaceae cyanobacterium]